MRKVSDSTVGRLSLYRRLLMELDEQGVTTVSSDELARRSDTTAAQVRKDLSAFGTFGQRGLGYRVRELVGELGSILGLERRWRVALVGAGKIGSALFAYDDFRRQGFFIEAVIDSDPAKVGERMGDLEIDSDRDLESVLCSASIDIVIVAVPADAAQSVVDRVVRSGIRGILNFAPTQLRVPSGVFVKSVNMALEIEGLSYALAREERTNQRRARDGTDD